MTAATYYFTRRGSASRHEVSFNPACFSCWGCSCEFKVDGVNKFTLNKYDKIKCLNFKQWGLEKTDVTITLEGTGYRDFIRCVEAYSKTPTTEN
jgi:hypothetical protein